MRTEPPGTTRAVSKVVHVRDIMKRNPLTVGEDEALTTAQSLMAWNGIRHLPVLRRRRVCGILSERDLLAYRAGQANWKAARVRDAMTPAPQFAHPEDSLTEVAGRMASARIGALPVVEEGTLVGLVTTTDVLAGEVQSAMAVSAPRSRAIARDAMTPAPLTVLATDRLIDAARIMVTRRIRHLPVLDEHARPVGILSERDVRAAIGDPAAAIAERSRFLGLQVSQAMSEPSICVREDEPVSRLARLFADARIGALLVVDPSGALVGLISYVDIVRILAV